MKQRRKKKKESTSETSGTMLNAPTFESYESWKKRDKKDHEKIFEEIIDENLPKMGKEIVTQVEEPQRAPNRINPRQNTPRHIIIQLKRSNTKNKY